MAESVNLLDFIMVSLEKRGTPLGPLIANAGKAVEQQAAKPGFLRSTVWPVLKHLGITGLSTAGGAATDAVIHDPAAIAWTDRASPVLGELHQQLSSMPAHTFATLGVAGPQLRFLPNQTAKTVGNAVPKAMIGIGTPAAGYYGAVRGSEMLLDETKKVISGDLAPPETRIGRYQRSIDSSLRNARAEYQTNNPPTQPTTENEQVPNTQPQPNPKPSPNPEGPNKPFLPSIPNWGKGLGILGGAAGLGMLTNSLSGEEKDEETGQMKQRMPWLGPLAGAGALGIGASYLTGGDYGKLVDPAFWNKTSSCRSLPPLVLAPYVIKFSAVGPIMEPPVPPTPPSMPKVPGGPEDMSSLVEGPKLNVGQPSLTKLLLGSQPTPQNGGTGTITPPAPPQMPKVQETAPQPNLTSKTAPLTTSLPSAPPQTQPSQTPQTPPAPQPGIAPAPQQGQQKGERLAERATELNPALKDPAHVEQAGKANLAKNMGGNPETPGMMDQISNYWNSLGNPDGSMSIQQILLAAGLSVGALGMMGLLTGSQNFGGGTGMMMGLGGLAAAAYGAGAFDPNSSLRKNLAGVFGPEAPPQQPETLGMPRLAGTQPPQSQPPPVSGGAGPISSMNQLVQDPTLAPFIKQGPNGAMDMTPEGMKFFMNPANDQSIGGIFNRMTPEMKKEFGTKIKGMKDLLSWTPEWMLPANVKALKIPSAQLIQRLGQIESKVMTPAGPGGPSPANPNQPAVPPVGAADMTDKVNKTVEVLRTADPDSFNVLAKDFDSVRPELKPKIVDNLESFAEDPKLGTPDERQLVFDRANQLRGVMTGGQIRDAMGPNGQIAQQSVLAGDTKSLMTLSRKLRNVLTNDMQMGSYGINAQNLPQAQTFATKVQQELERRLSTGNSAQLLADYGSDTSIPEEQRTAFMRGLAPERHNELRDYFNNSLFKQVNADESMLGSQQGLEKLMAGDKEHQNAAIRQLRWAFGGQETGAPEADWNKFKAQIPAIANMDPDNLPQDLTALNTFGQILQNAEGLRQNVTLRDGKGTPIYSHRSPQELIAVARALSGLKIPDNPNRFAGTAYQIPSRRILFGSGSGQPSYQTRGLYGYMP